MILEQDYLRCLAHASYLIGDTATPTAFIVDPQRDVAVYIEPPNGTNSTFAA